jgi:hypothetical protein
VADERDAVEPERVDHRLEILLSVGDIESARVAAVRTAVSEVVEGHR